MDYNTSLKRIEDHYGIFNQRDMLVEECAELIQAISKCKRGEPGGYDNFLEEMADVQIMLDQMYDYVGRDRILAIMGEKISRQLKRIEEEENA